MIYWRPLSCISCVLHTRVKPCSIAPAAAKLEELQGGLDEVVGKIHGLEQRKAALLQELEALDRQLFKVHTKCQASHLCEAASSWSVAAGSKGLVRVQSTRDVLLQLAVRCRFCRWSTYWVLLW